MEPEEIFRRFRELTERFEQAEEPGEPLAAEFESLAEQAASADRPGLDVIARKAERYASHVRTGFPPLEE